MSQPRWFARLAGLPLLLLLPFAAEAVPQFTVYVTTEVEDQQPVRKDDVQFFDCSDRIYVVVEASGLTPGKHQMTVRWINPAEAQQERTDYAFTSGSHARIWAWLQLSGPTGSVLGRLFDSSFGMEEFIGEWTARTYIDDDSVAASQFNILC